MYDKIYKLYNKIINNKFFSKPCYIVVKSVVATFLYTTLKFNFFNTFIFFYKVNNKLKLGLQKYKFFNSYLVRNIHSTKNIEQKCYYLHILFVEKLGTKELYREYIQSIPSLNNQILQYRLGAYEIPWIWFLNPEFAYDDYFLLHRKLLEKISSNLYESSNNIEVKHVKNRIAIMVMGLHSKRHASTRLEIYLANEFVQHGYEVTIFVADTYKICNNEQYTLEPLFSRHNYSTIFMSDHNNIKHTKVNIIYNQGDTAKEMYNNYINRIYEYAPEFIIDITWENAIFNPILKKDFKIISVPLGGNITSADVHGYISRDLQESINTNKIYRVFDNIKMVEGNIYIPYDLTINKRFKRELYGIEKNDFVVITVGNRLEHEISHSLMHEMSKILDKYSNIKWILVGPAFSISEQFNKYIKNRQIILWGYERELPSLYAICDCFLNPPRVGGGGSIACFVQMNKPAIVANIPSDILPFIGQENTINYINDESYINIILKIYNDKQYGEALAENQKKSLMRYELTPENFINQIINLYNIIKEEHHD